MADQAISIEQLQQQVVELQREHAECRAALQERDLRYRTLLYNLPEKVVHKDRDSVYLSCNKNFASDFGMTSEQMVGKTDYDLYPQDHEMAEKYRADDRRIMASGGTEEIEERYSTPATKGSIVRTLKAAVKDEHGNVTGILGIFSDITARKQAEEELRNSERTLRTLIDASPESILLMDAEGTILFANQTTAHRLCRSVDEIIGRKTHDVLPAEVAANRLRYFEEVLRTGKPIRFEDERSDRYIETAVYPVIDDTGKVATVAVLGIDRTERKRAEEALQKAHNELEERVEERTAELTKANEQLKRQVEERKRAEEGLRESEEKYRTLVETSPDAVFMLDLEGHITLASHRAAELYGSERVDEMLGRNPLEFFAPEDHERFLKNFHRTLKEGCTRDIEYTFIRKDGARFAGEVSASAIGDLSGMPRAAVGIVRDITERKRAEEALREQHDELRAIYEGMFNGLVILDFETKRIIRVNSSLCRMLGYTEEELLSMSVMDIHPTDEVPRIMQRIQARVDEGYREDVDVPVLRKDGSILYANVIGNPLVQRGRQCIAAFFRDVTQRKRAEEALRKEHETLKHLLRSSDHERQLIAYEVS